MHISGSIWVKDPAVSVWDRKEEAGDGHTCYTSVRLWQPGADGGNLSLIFETLDAVDAFEKAVAAGVAAERVKDTP